MAQCVHWGGEPWAGALVPNDVLDRPAAEYPPRVTRLTVFGRALHVVMGVFAFAVLWMTLWGIPLGAFFLIAGLYSAVTGRKIL